MSLSAHDYSADEAKQQTRLKTIEAAMTSPFLWSVQSNWLKHSWLEIDAQNSPTWTHLRDNNLLNPAKRYICVNGAKPDLTDREVAMKATLTVCEHNRKVFEEDISAGRYVIENCLLEDCFNRPEEFADVGVIVADGHMTLGNNNLIAHHMQHFAFARRQAVLLGQALLVIVLGHRGASGVRNNEALERWHRDLSSFLGRDFGVDYINPYQNKGRRPMTITRILFARGL